jgi:hypothetical protein
MPTDLLCPSGNALQQVRQMCTWPLTSSRLANFARHQILTRVKRPE